MIRDITIGQYYPVDSPIHRLDARIKLGVTFLFIVTLFLVNSFTGYLFAAACMALVIRASKVPLKFMLKGLKSIMIIILFTAFINLFMTRGEHVLWHWGFLTLTVEGILMAIKMCVRLVMLIIGSSLLTLTTTPIQLTDAIEYFDTGNLLQKAKSLIPILVPLFISAFRRAEELAMAMEARCYHGDEHRTRMKEMKMEKRDYRAMTIACCYTLAIFGLRFAAKVFPFVI